MTPLQQVEELQQEQRRVDQLFADLSREYLALDAELRLTRQEVVAQTQAKEALEKEIQRLKEGHFTEEEFQNLCHTFPPEKVCAFRQGCHQYQNRLLGEEAVRLDIARELRWALHQVACAERLDDLAQALASVLAAHPPLKSSCENGGGQHGASPSRIPGSSHC